MTAPLEDLTVVVTRPEPAASVTARALESAGARVRRLSAIEIVATIGGVAEARRLGLSADAWLLTSPRALDLLLDAPGPAPRLPAFVVGRASAARARARGLDVAASSEGGIDDLVGGLLTRRDLLAGRRIVWPRGALARTEALDPLRAAGALVLEVVLYETRPRVAAAEARSALEGADAVLFASPSAVDALCAVVPEEIRGRLDAVALGPTTAAALEDRGFREVRTARRPDDAAIVAALRRS